MMMRCNTLEKDDALEKEEVFHDAWASDIDVENVPVDLAFEACTAPENRIIISRLGNIDYFTP